MSRGIEELLEKAIAHKAYLDSCTKDIKEMTLMSSKKQEELSNLNELYRITSYSSSYLEGLIREESGKFIKKLNDILDYGVKTIFYDCDYSVEVRVSDNNKATIHLVYDDENGNKLSPDVQQCGGGIKSVIGCISQIFFLFYYHVEPVLFMDESLSQISSQYLPHVMDLINELAKKNGLKVLLITHDVRMLAYGAKQYEISDGKALLVQDSTGGEFID